MEYASEKEFLANYDSSIYEKLSMTTDILLLSVSDEKQDNKNILPYFLVGPEGGFSDEEVKFLSAQKQVFSLHLGNTILRAETASIAVLSCWQYRVF